MSSHNYNMKLNFLAPIEESTPSEVSTSTDAIVDTPFETNANTSEVSGTATLVVSLEKKVTSIFDGLDNGILNLKDVIIKNLQVENEKLRKKANIQQTDFNS